MNNYKNLNFKKNILNKYIKKNKIDAILFNSKINIFWFIEFNISKCYLLYSENKQILYLDNRYFYEVKKKYKNIFDIKLIDEKNNFLNQLLLELNKKNIKKIGFEENKIIFNEYKKIKNFFNKENIKLKPINFENLRIIKNKKEINYIKKSCKITENIIKNIIKNIKVNITENDIKKMILNDFLKNEVEIGFDIIVASGKRGAFPHAKCTNKKIKNNEFITIDIGCKYKGYNSDITRTFGIGKPNKKLLEIYNIVYNSQKLGIKFIKPNITTKEIDLICRNYIKNKGYENYFIHSTGHGIGLEVHEQPFISKKSNIKLKEGMVVTIEPGIYIPGLGGVRIEDNILVTKKGYKILSKSNKKLLLI